MTKLFVVVIVAATLGTLGGLALGSWFGVHVEVR